MKKNNIFWGLVLIMAAGMVLLHSFGLDPGIGVFRLLIGIVLAFAFRQPFLLLCFHRKWEFCL